MQKTYIAIILLVVVIGVGLDFIIYQKNIISRQKVNLEEISGQLDGIKAEKEGLARRLSAEAQQIDNLNSKIKQYLNAEGRKCDKDALTCLDELTAKLKPSEIRCELISDGVCPPFCGLSLDYDCCIEKGYKWIQGQGCYS